MKDKMVFRNFIWNSLGSILASFNSLFFLVAITRINGLESAGVFSICVTTAFILYIFAIYSGRNCQVTDIKGEIKDRDYMISRIITCIGMLGITLGFMVFSHYSYEQNIIVFFLCLWKGMEAFADVFYAVLQKNEKLYLVGQSLTLKSIVGIILFVVVDLLTYNVICACGMLVLVSICVFLTFDLPKTKPFIKKEEKATKENIIKIYKNEFFLFASAFLTMYLLNAPKYAIEKYLTNEIQGIYAMILMPASILPLFAQFVIAPTMNELTQHYKEKRYQDMKKIERKLIVWIIGFGSLAIILAYFIGIPALNLIYRVNLTNYQLPLVGIIFAYVIYSSGFVKTIILTIYRKIKEQFIIYCISSIAVYMFSNIFVKQYGENGIILTYIVVMCLYYVLFSLVTTYQYHKNLKNRRKYIIFLYNKKERNISNGK